VRQLRFDGPVRFTVLPGALRVRVASHHPGALTQRRYGPRASRSTLVRLTRLAFAAFVDLSLRPVGRTGRVGAS